MRARHNSIVANMRFFPFVDTDVAAAATADICHRSRSFCQRLHYWPISHARHRHINAASMYDSWCFGEERDEIQDQQRKK